MYAGFWDQIKNAFNQSGNSLYKILAINLLVYFILLVSWVFLSLAGQEALYNAMRSYLMMPAAPEYFITQPWTIFTYMFTHDRFFHILFNMLFLYWFGLLVMEYLGSRKLANLYILGGITGGLFYMVVYNIAPLFSDHVDRSLMLGASAGVYAIVVAAATLSPNTSFRLLLLGNVKIKYIAIFYVLVAFANSAGSNAGGELAHLGGAALGYIYVVQLRNGRDLGIPVQVVGQFFEKLFSRKSKVKVTYRKKSYEYKSEPLSKSRAGEMTSQEEIDRILDKIAEKGYDSLSKDEKRKLFEFSNKA
ncbi:rhomboid family intramembrane serine protease [Litoribacter ruber]|uniref:Rhomboid family intramembrane serine protease n=1 Tax=Litoribacter ruber TaxID=702568 RepID=A0AAP2G0J1_9BACT|nr:MULTISPECIES: rhomboid family intramembrane serine protease [Litoribacter]MBS9522442.1 rhomboid family intramembrane serine protease [Litoribacter alkaliphilus]MBT0810962.1 rhomboid family intramembrane serine protease [Litoribacter ruber]